jgi:hypothetical protein
VQSNSLNEKILNENPTAKSPCMIDENMHDYSLGLLSRIPSPRTRMTKGRARYDSAHPIEDFGSLICMTTHSGLLPRIPSPRTRMIKGRARYDSAHLIEDFGSLRCVAQGDTSLFVYRYCKLGSLI